MVGSSSQRGGVRNRLVDSAGAVAEASTAESHEPFIVAQMRLLTGLTGEGDLSRCVELTTVEREHAFEVFLEAQEELDAKLRELRAVSLTRAC